MVLEVIRQISWQKTQKNQHDLGDINDTEDKKSSLSFYSHLNVSRTLFLQGKKTTGSFGGESEIQNDKPVCDHGKSKFLGKYNKAEHDSIESLDGSDINGYLPNEVINEEAKEDSDSNSNGLSDNLDHLPKFLPKTSKETLVNK